MTTPRVMGLSTAEDSAWMILSKSDAIELSRLVGRNVRAPEELLSAVRRLATVNVDGQRITIEPALLERLKSRCINQPFGPWMERTVKQLLHGFVGW